MKRLAVALTIGACAALLGWSSVGQAGARTPQPNAVWVPIVCALPTPTPTLVPATVRVEPTCSQFDAPGDDNENAAEEYVCFRNDGQVAARMDGWEVRDSAQRTYVFGPFALEPAQAVRLRTGAGVNTATDLYWGLGRAVWNNDGDVVSLYDAAGLLVDQYTYGLK